ncbi:histidine kinase [bacterium SCSIO 12643]|nr:histidine kinase [bacterium SCSIO 12643]
MFRWIITIGFWILLSLPLIAGGPGMKNFREDQETLKELKALAPQVSTNPEESIKVLDGQIKLAIRNNLSQSLAYAYLLMGSAYRELHQPQLALHFLQLSQENYVKPIQIKQKEFKGKINYTIPSEYYYELGEIYTQLGRYSEANTEYERFQKNSKNRTLITASNYALAQNYYALEEFEEAISVYEKLLVIEQQAQNDIQIRMCYSALAACYISMGKTDQGLLYYKKSVQGVSQTSSLDNNGNYSQIAENKEIVTKALRKQNKLEEELQVRNDNLSITNDNLEYLRLAQTYLKAQNITKTESSLDQYFENISYNIIDMNEIQVIKDMALILKSQNRDNKAFDYLIHYEELSDTIQNRLLQIEQNSQQVGSSGYQNYLQLEILQKDKEISENTIQLLMRESELNEKNLQFQKTIIWLLAIGITLIIIALVYIVRVSKQRRIANQQLALRSLRTQMNPHFIFNALNSVNSFISMSDERAANKFLSEFSTLMRTVMENSEHEFISLTKELEILKIYLDLEHFRFQNKFDYQLNIDPQLDTDELVIPPMIIQPYIENAIWHGLRYKEDKGTLKVAVNSQNSAIRIIVEDDGIGRNKSQEIKTKNQRKSNSTALKNIKQRVELFNDLHRIQVQVNIADLHQDGSGTVVTLIIPQPNYE